MSMHGLNSVARCRACVAVPRRPTTGHRPVLWLCGTPLIRPPLDTLYLVCMQIDITTDGTVMLVCEHVIIGQNMCKLDAISTSTPSAHTPCSGCHANRGALCPRFRSLHATGWPQQPCISVCSPSRASRDGCSHLHLSSNPARRDARCGHDAQPAGRCTQAIKDDGAH